MATIKKQRLRQSWETATEDKGTWSYDVAEMKFYKSKVWRGLRASILQNEPLCRECKKKGLIVEAKVLDHITPIRMGGDRLDENNLQPMCHSCHNTKSAKERKR